MINKKRVVLLLPLYLALVIAIEMVFNHARLTPGKPVPLWLIVAFIATALAVAVIAIGYMVRRAVGKVPQQRHHTYMALLVAGIVSGFFSDALKGVASLLLHGQPLWILVPIYTLGYVVFCAVLVYTANRLERCTGDAQDRSSSAV